MKKLKLWLKKAGFTSLAYLGIFAALYLLGYKFLGGAALGIFCYVNWNVIVKLWNNQIQPEVDKVVDKVIDKVDGQLKK